MQQSLQDAAPAECCTALQLTCSAQLLLLQVRSGHGMDVRQGERGERGGGGEGRWTYGSCKARGEERHYFLLHGACWQAQLGRHHHILSKAAAGQGRYRLPHLQPCYTPAHIEVDQEN